MQTQLLDINLLTPNKGQIEGLPKNPRFINDTKFSQLIKSIQDDPEMMELRECLVYPFKNEYIIIGGDKRYRACLKLGYEKVPCKIIPENTPIEKLRAYVIKDNVSSGENDWDILANEWNQDELVNWGVEIPVFTSKNETEEDDYDIPDEIKTDIILGDLFQIGQHRLLCGDSTNADNVNKLLDGGKPILMVTDPPYGVNYDANWRNEADRSNGRPIGGWATMKVNNDDRADWLESFSLFSGDIVYCWHASASAIQFANDLMKAGFEIKNQIIWVKNNIVIGRGDYHWKHEPCWYAVRKGKKHNWQGSRKENTCWEIDKPMKSETGHSTQKPVECMARPIRNNTFEKESVYDPFLGSGTTMVAAHQLNRMCYGIEIDPKYCQIIIDRMKKLDPAIEIKKNGLFLE